jgi:hypothetical protein
MDSEGTQPTRVEPTQPTPSLVPEDRGRLKRGSRSRIFMVGGLLTVLLLVFLVLIVLPVSTYAYYQVYGRIVPGVSVGELELGGLTWQEAKEGLDAVYGVEYDVLVTDGDRVWKAKASDFGVGWNTEAMAQQALNVAHGKDFQSEVSEMIQSFSSGWEIDPILTFDPETALAELMKWGQTVNIPAQDAGISIENGEVKIVPSKEGNLIDEQETLNQIVLDPKGLLDQGELQLVMRVDKPQIEDLSGLAEEVEGILAGEFSIHAFDPVVNESYTWEVYRGTIADWLELQKTKFGYELIILDEEIENYARELSSTFSGDQYLEVENALGAIRDAMDGIKGDPLRVYHNETAYTVQPGDTLLEIGWELGFPFWMIMDANPYLY